MYKYVKVIPVELQTPTHWNMIGGALPPRRMCYRPAVFFRHLSLIALSFPHRKIRHALHKFYYLIFLLFRSCVSLKLRKTESVCTAHEILLCYRVKEDEHWRVRWHIMERREMRRGFWWGNQIKSLER